MSTTNTVLGLIIDGDRDIDPVLFGRERPPTFEFAISQRNHTLNIDDMKFKRKLGYMKDPAMQILTTLANDEFIASFVAESIFEPATLPGRFYVDIFQLRTTSLLRFKEIEDYMNKPGTKPKPHFEIYKHAKCAEVAMKAIALINFRRPLIDVNNEEWMSRLNPKFDEESQMSTYISNMIQPIEDKLQQTYQMFDYIHYCIRIGMLLYWCNPLARSVYMTHGYRPETRVTKYDTTGHERPSITINTNNIEAFISPNTVVSQPVQ